jgi:hypothetical protein
LPTQEGWDHIYAAVQFLAVGLAPAIIFSGGGTEVEPPPLLRGATPTFVL